MSDSWFNKLERVIQYMANNNGKKPTKKEPEIGSWLSDQLGFYRAGSGTAGMWVNEERLKAWREFMNKNEDQLLTKEEIWDRNLQMLGEFIDMHGRKPSETGCAEECALLRWSYDQVKRVKPGNDRYEKWTAFTTKYYVKETKIPVEHKEENKVEAKCTETPNHFCKGKDRNGDSCRNYGNPYCNYHSYLSEYTDAQLQQLKLCKGCNKWKDFPNKQCISCASRGKEIREKVKTNIVLCKSEGCTFKKSDENDYCGKHQLCVFVDKCKEDGLRPCAKYLIGCRMRLTSDYKFKSCQECLEKEREIDNAKRSVVSGEIINGQKQCSVCCKFKSADNYSDTKTCKSCRDEFKKQDAKRDKEHVRELDRIASQKPERKAVKNEWKENNYDKVVMYNVNYRGRQHNENQEEYLKRNAETMAKWRENNPEKVKEINEKNLKNMNKHLYNYIHKCEMNNINFELTKEQFEEIIIKPCYYCEIIQDKGFNGIDRMDSSRGYEQDNCVSCCDECNTMKGALDNSTFIRRAEHILTYNKIINCNLHPRIFANHSTINYNSYKLGAKSRNYVFELLKKDFDNIVSYDCYICGKQNSNRHKNGIDRYDNNIGYTLENVRPCCGQCNIMKKDMEYQYFINKLLKIYQCSQKQTYVPVCVPIVNSLNRNPNKPSREEICKISTEKRQERRNNMRNKYGDVEYKRMHAQKIAEQRRKKKESINITTNECL